MNSAIEHCADHRTLRGPGNGPGSRNPSSEVVRSHQRQVLAVGTRSSLLKRNQLDEAGYRISNNALGPWKWYVAGSKNNGGERATAGKTDNGIDSRKPSV